jgi:molybdenum cofactor biosynthesis protein A
VLYDNHNRPLNYLRLAVTDRCNLRCFYCMPQERIQYLPKKEILTFEEMERLVNILARLGITKVRLTGGEPFVRNDLMQLIRRIVEIPGIKDLHLTTNGILTAPHIPELRKLGVASVNLSLDSLDRNRFFEITRRDEFEKTWETLQLFLEHEIPLKINTVVMTEKNTQDIIPLVELTRNTPVDVRFIEEMPFNGKGAEVVPLAWNHHKIISHIREQYPDLIRLTDPANSTAYNYRVTGFKGTIGVIAAFSRTFCGTCNRIRVTARGDLKTCLYGEGVLDLKALMRTGASDELITEKLLHAFSNRAKDGFEAEKQSHENVFQSMSTIGG